MFKLFFCQPEPFEGWFCYSKAPVGLHRLRQAQADSFYIQAFNIHEFRFNYKI